MTGALANEAMSAFVSEFRARRLGGMDEVAPALASMADELTIKNGCAALCKAESFPTLQSVRQWHEDWTGFECFANKMHIEDLLPGMDAVDLLGQAVGFSKIIQQRVDGSGLQLRFIVSVDKFGGHDQCVFRFHVIRPSESWLAEDIEGYAEPVLTWTSEWL